MLHTDEKYIPAIVGYSKCELAAGNLPEAMRIALHSLLVNTQHRSVRQQVAEVILRGGPQIAMNLLAEVRNAHVLPSLRCSVLLFLYCWWQFIPLMGGRPVKTKRQHPLSRFWPP